MRRSRFASAAAALALFLTACSGMPVGPTGSAPATPGAESHDVVDVVTWWSSGVEQDGLDALVDVFASHHPGIEFVNEGEEGGAGSHTKETLGDNLAASNPPDTYQVHAGAELTADIAAGYVQDMSTLYDTWGLRQAFPTELIDRITVNGAIYSIPSNIHRANMTWVSVSALESAGVNPQEPPEDISAWLDDLEALRNSGIEYPLAVGMPWTQLQLLETVLIADLGPEAYEGLFDGTTSWESPAVTQAFHDVDALMGFADPQLLDADWEEAMAGVISADGTQAYAVMGDWAPAAFEAAGMDMGVDYVAWPVPGTDGVFDFLADAFTLPVNSPHPEAALAWLDSVSSLDGQIALSLAKGSIPARSDLTPEQIEQFSDYQQSTMESFASDTIVSSIAHGAALPISVTTVFLDSLERYTNHDLTIDELQAEFAAAVNN